MESSLFLVNHPTKCDVLLYSDPGMAPTGAAECSDDTPRMSSNGFDPGVGFSGDGRNKQIKCLLYCSYID